ncbi:unnamed protein product, partial [Chrysoparadoxa australica]
PGVFVQYKADDDIVFYNKDGWWILESGQRICEGKLSQYEDFAMLPPISNLIDRIREFGPLWSRWMARGDQYELVYREALFNVLEINQGLEKYSAKVAIFNTGVSHHISTMIFEVACTLANVKQVFLYTNNIMLGRLLPLIQDQSIKDRRPVSIRFSEEKAMDNINRFIQNRQLGGTPESGGDLPKRHEESILFAIASISKSLLKDILRPLKRCLSKDKLSTSVLNRFYDYPIYILFKQVIQQHFALLFYRKSIDKNKLISHRSSKQCRLLIAAHFQPEATSFPEGWDCHNNIDIVLELRRKGYTKELFYKEHPATFMYTAEGVNFTRVGMSRSKHYYQQLLQLGCTFIDSSTELPLSVENDWYLPVTITGTIAIERSLVGLHTIVTGNPWYKGLPGTLSLSEVNSLAELKREWVTPDPNVAESAF